MSRGFVKPKVFLDRMSDNVPCLLECGQIVSFELHDRNIGFFCICEEPVIWGPPMMEQIIRRTGLLVSAPLRQSVEALP